MKSRLRSHAIRNGRIVIAVGISMVMFGLSIANPLVVCVGCGVTLIGGYLALYGEVGSF